MAQTRKGGFRSKSGQDPFHVDVGTGRGCDASGVKMPESQGFIEADGTIARSADRGLDCQLFSERALWQEALVSG
jgi:hypothetical protein